MLKKSLTLAQSNDVEIKLEKELQQLIDQLFLMYALAIILF